MLKLGFKNFSKASYEALLFKSHLVHVTIQIMDLNHNHIHRIGSNRLLEGQIDFDGTSDIQQSLKMSIFDPRNTMEITSDSPNEGAAFMDRMVRVIYSIAPPDGSSWYDVPIFTGPMTKVDRDEDVLSIECQSKEYLSFVSPYTKKTYGKGQKKTSVILDILRDHGETRFSIPSLDRILGIKLAVDTDSIPWTICRNLASGLNRELNYDGRGVATLRSKGGKTVFTFGPTRLTGKPQIGYTTDNLINAAKVVGAPKKGKGKKGNKDANAKKKKPYARYRAPRSNPLSPYALGRNGKPRDYMAVIEDSKLMSNAACLAVAKKRVRQGLIEGVEVSFDSLIVPHLQLGDAIKIRTTNVSATAKIKKMSFSLVSANASYGYNRNLSPKVKKIRRHRK